MIPHPPSTERFGNLFQAQTINRFDPLQPMGTIKISTHFDEKLIEPRIEPRGSIPNAARAHFLASTHENVLQGPRFLFHATFNLFEWVIRSSARRNKSRKFILDRALPWISWGIRIGLEPSSGQGALADS